MRALTFNVYDTLHPSVFVGNLLYLQSILVMPFGSNGPLWSLARVLVLPPRLSYSGTGC